jgi:hypothetical protein
MDIESLEDVAALPSLPLEDRLSLICPGGEAVYFILNAQDEILYIGATVHMHDRLGCHRVVRESPGNGAVRVAWFACNWRTAHEIEREMIYRWKPPLNVRGKRWKLARRHSP